MKYVLLTIICLLAGCVVQHVPADVGATNNDAAPVIVMTESPKQPFPRGTVVTACDTVNLAFDLARFSEPVEGCRPTAVTAAHPRSRNFVPDVGQVDIWEFQRNFRDYYFLARWPKPRAYSGLVPICPWGSLPVDVIRIEDRILIWDCRWRRKWRSQDSRLSAFFVAINVKSLILLSKPEREEEQNGKSYQGWSARYQRTEGCFGNQRCRSVWVFGGKGNVRKNPETGYICEDSVGCRQPLGRRSTSRLLASRE